MSDEIIVLVSKRETHNVPLSEKLYLSRVLHQQQPTPEQRTAHVVDDPMEHVRTTSEDSQKAKYSLIQSIVIFGVNPAS